MFKSVSLPRKDAHGRPPAQSHPLISPKRLDKRVNAESTKLRKVIDDQVGDLRKEFGSCELRLR